MKYSNKRCDKHKVKLIKTYCSDGYFCPKCSDENHGKVLDMMYKDYIIKKYKLNL